MSFPFGDGSYPHWNQNYLPTQREWQYWFSLKMDAAIAADFASSQDLQAETQARKQADAQEAAVRAQQDALLVPYISLALPTGAGLSGYTQGAQRSISRTVQGRLRDFATIQDFGAVADGATDTSAVLYSLPVGCDVPPGVYHVAVSGTITANLHLHNGAIFKVASGVTVTFSKPIDAGSEQAVFQLADDTAKVSLANQEVSIGWFGIATDGTQDVGPIVNMLIADASLQGRTIRIPGAASYLVNTPIDLQGMNYITIVGNGRSERSNLDYTLAESEGPGLTESVVWPGGGPRFVLGPTVAIGIQSLPPNTTGYPRITGINLRGFMVVGNRDTTVAQKGIFLSRNNDTTNIVDVGVINFQTNADSIGLHLEAADSAVMRGVWCAECNCPIQLYNSNDMLITSCSFGGKAGSPTVGISEMRRLTFTGNTIYPDGEECISLLDSFNCVFAGNTITSRFTGIITLYGSYGNIIADNFIRNPADTGTTWITSDKDLWSSQNYDPAGRDELFGMIYLDGTSNDNVIRGNQIWSWMDNTSACGIRVKSGASGNWIVGNKFCGSAAFTGSANLVAVEDAPAGDPTYVLDTCLSTQATVGGSVVTRYLASS
ncbi:right-handed parallel beta-helix repeat-containing protein [Komagataeibacter oboediens]|uniref:right-handed parallel beta-helix repeat-containing protein n=1 Tax=Komagataeibacter oboediens TaxID=65958 RepID=UPI0023DC3A99|nr:right-handed parallel beta-helix repeat-containing protein [Komagataeibacter oboediens]WEQ51211.1 right-handed parallel beta-helix repeat-containing protein [Komagataeibacter oboediens]